MQTIDNTIDDVTRDTEQKPKSGTSNWHEFGKYRGRVLHREAIARDVNLYTVEKPEGFEFVPGQAVDLAIDEVPWRDEQRPFTITSRPTDPRLEFIIKSYPAPDHDGMTEHLGRDVAVGDRVIFGDPWGAIRYRGPGVFIAGGAGVTPFISMIRDLSVKGELGESRMFFSNKTVDDVFAQGELFRHFGHRIVCTLTQQRHRDYEFGRVDRDWLTKRVSNFDQPFYLCGPPAMVESLRETLQALGANGTSIVTENLH